MTATTDDGVIEVVFKDPKIDPEKMMYAELDPEASPQFGVTEVAKLFFARSSHWVRYCEREGYFHLEGKPVGRRKTQQGVRVYNLHDVEQMAHALASHDRISGTHLYRVLTLLQAEGAIWGHLTAPTPEDQSGDVDA